LKVLADAEQSAVPAAVASKVLTWKLLSADVVGLVLELEAAVSAAPESALLMGVEPKVSCTRASIAS
jgi:hypothetical protein